MVYKRSAYFKSFTRGPCEKVPKTKNPISVGASIEQKPWRPTLRRGKILAEPVSGKPSYEAIPPYLGPNVVDSKKKSAPAYSFGRKIIPKVSYTDDGPAKFDISGLCNKGLRNAPAYSLISRKPDIQAFQSPSSNKYSIDIPMKATIKTIPTFSFGKKPKVLRSMATPAPNVYHMPPVLGTAKQGKIKAAPAYSMLGRPKPREIPITIFPGPGEYENNYRYTQNVSPRFSMRQKHKVITDEHMKPGPGDHCPERYVKHKSVPAPSFAIPHSPYKCPQKAFMIPECKLTTIPEWIL